MATKNAIRGEAAKKEPKKLVKTTKIITRPNWIRIICYGVLSLLFRLVKVLCFGICCTLIVSFVLWGKYGNSLMDFYYSAKQDIDNSTIETFRTKETSYVYDKDNKPIAQLRTDKDSLYLTSNQIPDEVKECLISIEDRRFYKHRGVDLQSTGKAVYLLIVNHGVITRGGSTITQQLVKNVFLTQEQSFERKFKEMFYAIEMERKYTKEQILEFYINDIYFGNGYYGIGAAAKGYFSCSVDELSLAQIAYLCAIPNSPTYYDPIQNPEHTKSRQRTILNNVRQYYPKKAEECSTAMGEKIKLKVSKQKFYNYEATYAIDCTVRYLMKLDGFSFKYSFDSMKQYKKYKKKYSDAYEDARIRLYSGGYSVYTTLDSKVQKELQQTVDDVMSFSSEKDNDIYKLQAASTVIDNDNGKVIAIVGGRSQDSIESNKIYTLNRAFQMTKQPGSTIKPLVVYTPALMNGYTKNSIVSDTPFAGGPHNSNGKYSGSVPLYYAVEQSKNVVAWKLFSAMGPKKNLGFIQRMQFSSIVPNDYYPAASLGGLTYGCTTVEMASGYSTLCNDGKFREPTCIKSILNSTGFEIYNDAKEKLVYSEDAARTMTEILQGVIKNGTARGLGLENNMPAAAKTGTTNDQTNGWFCGYTPYYSVAVWVGTDGTQTINNLWGSTYPGSIWKGIQDKLNKGLPIKQFNEVEKTSKSATSSTTSAVATTEEFREEDSQEELIKDIKEKITQYENLQITDEKSISKESDLYNSISSRISQIKDKTSRASLQSLLDKAESKVNARAKKYEAKNNEPSESEEEEEEEDSFSEEAEEEIIDNKDEGYTVD